MFICKTAPKLQKDGYRANKKTTLLDVKDNFSAYLPKDDIATLYSLFLEKLKRLLFFVGVIHFFCKSEN